MSDARYEVAIKVLDVRYVDRLVVALARQGYNVYFNADQVDGGVVCFTATDDEVTPIDGGAE